jgi:transitional endoplasmic reticulum ATPase
MTETILKISEIVSQIGKNEIFLKSDIARSLGLNSGDAIMVTNVSTDKKHVAVYNPRHDGSLLSGEDECLIDPQIRMQIQAGLGDRIKIKKATLSPATRVIVAPLNTNNSVSNVDTLRELLEGKIVNKNSTISLNFIDLSVTDIEPLNGWCVITPETDVAVGEPIEIRDQSVKKVTYEDLGGLQSVIQKIREMVEMPIRFPEIFQQLGGVQPPKGVLLYGPPGTGKTLLARAVANETNSYFISIKGPEIMNKFYGQSEENLRNIFREAQENAPAIIFIDEIDSITAKREDARELERRVVSQLLTLMDGLDSRGNVVVIAATNRVNDIDGALRRPGRFDREIEVGVPNTEGRLQILQIHSKNVNLDASVDLKEFADKTHGYVGADLESLVREAAFNSIRRVMPQLDYNAKSIPKKLLSQLIVTRDDFENAFKGITPSAMRELAVTTPSETWDDVGGLKEAKAELQEIIEWPLKYPEVYKRMRGEVPKGLILTGVPGVGKTLLIKALAHETKANFISIKGPSIFNKYVGESERMIREIFKKARESAPCIIFFDEIDAIAAARGSRFSGVSDQIVAQLLTEIDGLEKLNDVIVIAATNRIELIDSALLRPGRLGTHLEIGLPDREGVLEILKIHLKDRPLDKSVKIEQLADAFVGMSGAELASICNEAASFSIRDFVIKNKRDLKENETVLITLDHIARAKDKISKNFAVNKAAYERSLAQNNRDAELYA